MPTTNVFAINADVVYLNEELPDKCPLSLLLTQEQVENLNISLFEAIEGNNYEAARKALIDRAQSNSMKMTQRPNTTRTPLHTAVLVGNPDIVKLLFEFNAQTETKTEGRTALSHLAYQKHIDDTNNRLIVESFIEAIVSQKITHPTDIIDTAFHDATMAQNVIVAEAILEYAEHAELSISQSIRDKLNNSITFADRLFNTNKLFFSVSIAKEMRERQRYIWMSRQLAQRHSRREDNQNDVD